MVEILMFVVGYELYYRFNVINLNLHEICKNKIEFCFEIRLRQLRKAYAYVSEAQNILSSSISSFLLAHLMTLFVHNVSIQVYVINIGSSGLTSLAYLAYFLIALRGLIQLVLITVICGAVTSKVIINYLFSPDFI